MAKMRRLKDIGHDFEFSSLYFKPFQKVIFSFHKKRFSRVITSNSMNSTISIGKIGEDLCSKYLISLGFTVLCRNYRRKWGELDIIARLEDTIHFFEVKSVTSSSFQGHRKGHRPEDNVDNWKMMHIRRMVETYLSDEHIGRETQISLDVLCVHLNMQTRRAKISWIKDIIV